METLNITRIIPDSDGELIRTAKDDREYMQLELVKPNSGNAISTAKPRTKNVWGAGGTVNAREDRLFSEIKKRMGQVDKTTGYFKQELSVVASIQTVDIKEHFIPNPHGKHSHPTTNEPSNKIREYTAVVLEDENIESIARNNGMIPLSDLTLQEQQAATATAESSPVLTEQEAEPSIT